MVSRDEIAHCTALKRELVAYGCLRRYERVFGEALNARDLQHVPETDHRRMMLLDYFVLQHRFRNGRTVIDHFLAAHPELSEEDRALVRGWHTVVEGIFEVLERDGDALVVRNLVDENTYRAYSNSGTDIFDQTPVGCFLVTRLIPVGDAWMISAAGGVIPAEQRADVERRAAALATRQAAPRRLHPVAVR